jgi:hypothetical protein
MNSRYEITNLTVVARENTEHALAIAEAVQEHIKKVGSILSSRAMFGALHRTPCRQQRALANNHIGCTTEKVAGSVRA